MKIIYSFLKINFILIIFIVRSNTAFSQQNSFHRDDLLFGFRVGVPSGSLYEEAVYQNFMPLGFELDYCAFDSLGKHNNSIGFGFIFNYLGYNNRTNYYSLYSRYNVFSAGLRSDFHFLKIKKHEFYTGLMAWYIYSDDPDYSSLLTNTNTSIHNLEASVFFGWRWFFSPSFSVFVEAETVISSVNIGLSCKIE